MRENVPTIFPSRNQFAFNPGVPDRQLWALGMVVVQWGMTEFLRDQIVLNLVGDDKSQEARYKGLRSSRQRNEFWTEFSNDRLGPVDLPEALKLISRVQALNARRDDLVHRLWGGGMQGGSWSAGNYETTDAVLHRNRDEPLKTKSNDARRNVRWKLTFSEVRDTARQMGTLNSDLLISFLPADQRNAGRLHNVFAYVDDAGRLQVGVAAP